MPLRAEHARLDGLICILVDEIVREIEADAQLDDGDASASSTVRASPREMSPDVAPGARVEP
jgi:hypothetical protein